METEQRRGGMLNRFWDEQRVLVGFTGFIAVLGALFLNITPPSNSQVKIILANIQVFWLIILIASLTVLFVRFIKLIFKTEQELEKKHDIIARGVYSSTATLIFLWIILNFLAYIMGSYPGSFTMIILMLSGSVAISLYSWMEYLLHKHIEKFSLFSEFMAESFGVACVLAFGTILTEGLLFAGKGIHWSGVVGIITFLILFILSVSLSLNRKRKIFVSRAFQDMSLPKENKKSSILNIENFPNPKLDLPDEIRNSGEEETIKSFGAVENYLHSIREYIYTDIKLDYDQSDPKHIHAWIQRTISAIILRSIYIRNDFVDAFNIGNTVALFLALKAWFETVGVLAAILDLLENTPPSENLLERFAPYALGNRGKGDLRVGSYEAINVATMMEKADKYITKMGKENSADQEIKKIDAFFTDYYDIASNPSHPSFDAYEIVGSLESGSGKWQAKVPHEIKDEIVSRLPEYGALLMSPLFIKNICEKILKIESAHFSTLGSKKYFS